MVAIERLRGPPDAALRPPPPAARQRQHQHQHQHPVPQPRHLARPITPSHSARNTTVAAAATAGARASMSSDTRPARPRSLSRSATDGGKVLARVDSQESVRRKRGATNDPTSVDATPIASPSPLPSSSSHLSLVPGRARPKSPRLESRTSSSSACPEPRGATVSTGGGPSRTAAVSKIMAEGELGPAGQRKAGEVLFELRDGRSVSSSECGDDDDRDVPAFSELVTPYVFDCTMPVSIPDLPPSHSLPSPRNSPSYRSPLLCPSPLRIHSSPTRIPIAASFEDTLAGVQHPSAGSVSSVSVPADRMAASPTPSRSSFAPSSTAEHRTRDSSTSSSLSKDEQRRRRSSADTVAKVVHAQRPTLHTYTSFEATFDLHPPPSPPPSPKVETKSWWGLGA